MYLGRRFLCGRTTYGIGPVLAWKWTVFCTVPYFVFTALLEHITYRSDLLFF